MSLGDDAEERIELRALAHPVRLRMLSLLTGAALTAAEVARELDLTHANASYHLRQLLAAGMILQAGEERIRGGVAKRYRYDAGHDLARDADRGRRPDAHLQTLYGSLAEELIRRTQGAHFPDDRNLMVDAELWVEPEVWRDIRHRIGAATRDLHDAAQKPRTPGTIRTGTSIAMFRMDEQ